MALASGVCTTGRNSPLISSFAVVPFTVGVSMIRWMAARVEARSAGSM